MNILSIPLSECMQFRMLGGAVSAGKTDVDLPVIDLAETRPYPNIAPYNRQISPSAAAPSAPSNPLLPGEQPNEGMSEVCVIVTLGTVTDNAVVGLELFQVDNANGDNPRLIDKLSYGKATVTSAALVGTAASNKLVILDVVNVPGRFVRPKIKRSAADSAILASTALLAMPRRVAVGQHSSVLLQKVAAEV